MHICKIYYTTEEVEDEAVLTLDHMATHLQIVEAAARHCYPNEWQEIGDVFDEADYAETDDYLLLMAEWGILTLSYAIDDEFEEHHL